jgi:hypothetical protein
MRHPIERRAHTFESESALSPEILALLVTCGAQIRETDWAAVLEGGWRCEARGRPGPDQRHEDRRGDAA